MSMRIDEQARFYVDIVRIMVSRVRARLIVIVGQFQIWLILDTVRFSLQQ